MTSARLPSSLRPTRREHTYRFIGKIICRDKISLENTLYHKPQARAAAPGPPTHQHRAGQGGQPLWTICDYVEFLIIRRNRPSNLTVGSGGWVPAATSPPRDSDIKIDIFTNFIPQAQLMALSLRVWRRFCSSQSAFARLLRASAGSRIPESSYPFNTDRVA